MIHVQSFLLSGIYIHRDNAFLMDIEQLVARGVQGDEAALGSLYRAYHQRMTVICQRIVGDRQVAEKLAHDAFLLAFAKMNQLRNPRRFEQWLTSITTNVALRYKERHHEPQMLPLDALADTDITQENTTTEESISLSRQVVSQREWYRVLWLSCLAQSLWGASANQRWSCLQTPFHPSASSTSLSSPVEVKWNYSKMHRRVDEYS